MNASAIIPYTGAGRAFAQFVPGSVRAASFAYRNRANIKRAARFVSNRWANRSRKMRDPPKKRAKKRTYSDRAGDSSPFSWTSNSRVSTIQTLGPKDLTSNIVQFPTQGVSINTRIGFGIDLKGIKLCYNFFNDNNYPVEVNFAFVRLKQKQQFDTPTEEKSDFFVNNNYLVTDREEDFIEESQVAGYDMSYRCKVLNPRKFDVIDMRKRILDVRLTANASLAQGDWKWMHHKFYPIKKRLDFETNASTSPNYPFQTFVWWQPVDPANYSSAGEIRIEAFEQVSFMNRM